MITCSKCGKVVNSGEEREHSSELFCEDCYIDAVSPPVRKMYYENCASNFMLRLKDSYSVREQQYH
ncbi:MAG: hypothetical protein GY795_41545 [Desulfobacterales bacterium]|nr:hypothetical protein [Desulfobacterales bacterium]